MKNLNIIVILVILLYYKTTSAQQPNIVPEIKITPLHKFLQKNTDSTIIWEKFSYKLLYPEYLILTKKGDTISVYRYKDIPIPTGLSSLPKSIAYKILQRNNYEIQGVVPDINFYFNPVYLKADKLLGFWEQVSILKPWLLLDDSAEGKGCKLDKINIYDGDDANFYLLTKDKVKRLYFYAPLYYEKLCPGRSGRQNIIKIEELFERYFRD